MQEKQINIGDLVSLIDISPVKNMGVTATKYIRDLKQFLGGAPCIVIADYGTNVLIGMGSGKQKLVHKKFLKVVQELK